MIPDPTDPEELRRGEALWRRLAAGDALELDRAEVVWELLEAARVRPREEREARALFAALAEEHREHPALGALRDPSLVAKPIEEHELDAEDAESCALCGGSLPEKTASLADALAECEAHLERAQDGIIPRAHHRKVWVAFGEAPLRLDEVVTARALAARPDLAKALARGGTLVAPADARLRTREENLVGRVRNLCRIDAPLVMVLDEIARVQSARLAPESLELDRVEHWPSTRRFPGGWRRAALTTAMARYVLARRQLLASPAARLVNAAELIVRTGEAISPALLAARAEVLAESETLGSDPRGAALALAVRTLDDLAQTDLNDNQDDTTDQAFVAAIAGEPDARRREECERFFRWWIAAAAKACQVVSAREQ